MTPSMLSLSALGLAALALLAFVAWCIHALHHALPRRIARLEEALRVYNTANAALGRQLAELEAAVQRHLRAQAEAREEAPPPTPASRPEGRTPFGRGRPAAPSAAERYGMAASAAAPPRVPAPEDGFSEAELRLAQLIKSRLATMRLN
jgi:hypothetical protein